MTDESSGSRSDGDETLRRRAFVRLSSVVGVSALAGCSAIHTHGSSATSRSSTPTAGTRSPSGQTTANGTTGIEPPGAKRPLHAKYQGLHVLNRWHAGEADSRNVYTQFETPLDSFYVISHFQTPVLDANSHSVSVTGSDGRTVDVGMDSLLRDYSPETVTHTMQCAGNGRAYFAEMDGWQLGYGALGTARWTGVAVSEVFSRNGVSVPDGAWVMAAGADGPAADANRVFARSVPASKLLDDCVLAYRMNGHSLPLEHGFPVRLIVPGWYGTNSVKWLAELHVVDGMVRGSRWQKYSTWQQDHYRILPKGAQASEHSSVDTTETWAEIENVVAGRTDTYPYVYDMTVKSLIGYPGDGATVSPRKADVKIEVLGVAWAGDDRVSRVDVSTDGGDTWSQARFLGPNRGPAAWRRFRYLWTPSPGDHTLYSRATDEHGRTQPHSIGAPGTGLRTIRDDEYPWNQGGYASNSYRELGVHVSVQ